MTDRDPDLDPDLERRLRTMLLIRGDDVDTTLTGQALRARADRRTTRARRTAGQALAAAAVVVVTALVPQLLTREPQHPTPQRPGGVTHTVPAPPSPRTSSASQTAPASRSAPRTVPLTPTPTPSRSTSPPVAPTRTGR